MSGRRKYPIEAWQQGEWFRRLLTQLFRSFSSHLSFATSLQLRRSQAPDSSSFMLRTITKLSSRRQPSHFIFTLSQQRSTISRRHLHLMGDSSSSMQPSLKVLMLHGYTQNGQLFRAKTRVLEKHLKKAYPSVSLSYPNGPVQLKTTDVPGFDPSTASDPDDTEAYGWWRRSDTSDPPEYTGLENGLDTVAQILESEGPFDGVIGFSQGAALAAMTASLLEGNSRKQSFSEAQAKSTFAISFPSAFDSLSHAPLKFCVAYSGFIAPGERYRAFYEMPTIQTPVCHFIGSLDSVVEEKRTQALVDASGGPDKTQVVVHPGGHFVPTGKQYLDLLVSFIQRTISPESGSQPKDEERVEDMDVPF
jgi:predicted esterase